jgi:hypothetical protein
MPGKIFRKNSDSPLGLDDDFERIDEGGLSGHVFD